MAEGRKSLRVVIVRAHSIHDNDEHSIHDNDEYSIHDNDEYSIPYYISL